MLRNILLTFIALIAIAINAHADPTITTFASTSNMTSDGKILVSTSAATTANFKVVIGRPYVSGIYEGVSMTMSAVILHEGTEETISSTITVSGTDFNNGPFAEKRFSATIPANRGGRKVFLKYTYNSPKTGQLVGPNYSTTYYYTTYTAPPPPSDGIDPTYIRIIPNVRTWTAEMRESEHNFEAPANTVMTCRYHRGDENGATWYEYSTLKAVDYLGNAVAGTITVQVVTWSPWIKESNSSFIAPPGHVLIGRQHYGDENDHTRYLYGIVKLNGVNAFPMQGDQYVTVVRLNEEAGSNVWLPPAKKVILGRSHEGDEYGPTQYYYSTICANP